MQTERKLFLCGFLHMSVYEETRLLIELRKNLLIKKKKKTDSRFYAFLGPKTFKCQRYIYQILQKEWVETVLVSNKFHEGLPKLPDKL